MSPRVAAVCQLTFRLAEVPLRNVVYSRKPNISETEKSTVMITARTRKAVGEDGSDFQTRTNNSKRAFTGWPSFPKGVRARSHTRALHLRPGYWRSISTGHSCAMETRPYRGLRSGP